MRQLWIQVPRGHGQQAVDIARQHRATNLARLEAEGQGGAVDLLVGSVSNASVGGLLDDLEQLPELHVTFAPQGVLPLRPPAHEAARQVEDVEARSPFEILLSGLQSIGSWKGFLGYAVLSGIIAWIGLFTNTVYLLTAAMLIAPFAGPAMNAALATARGDRVLLGRSLVRYFSSLLASMASAAALTLLMRQEVATSQMVEVSELSTAAILLPLAAGAAGALNLAQSERSSLVSGAATGMLVAASLAPPTALIGMAAVLGKWGMVKGSVFVIVLQILGINTAGALVFRVFGLKPSGARYARGKPWVVAASMSATVLALAAMLSWQFWDRPELQRSTRSQHAAAVVQKVVRESGLAQLVEANVRFTRSEIPGQESLLGVVYVQRSAGQTVSESEIKRQLTKKIQQALETFEVTPLVAVTVLAPPSE